MKRQPPLHPYLFGLFPVLFVFAHNVEQLRAAELLLPALLVAGSTLTLVALLSRPVGGWSRASIVVSAFWLLFYAAGHLSRALGSGTTALALVLGLLLVAVALATRRLKRPAPWTYWLNVVSASLVALQIANAGLVQARRWSADRSHDSTVASEGTAALPDIYWIVLDGYGRHDVIQENYQHDNRAFLDFLAGQGFRVFERGRAPYNLTELSLASTLNLDLLEAFMEIDPDSNDRIPVYNRLWNSTVFDTLRSHDYSTVAFASGFDATEFTQADRFLSAGVTRSEFHDLLLSLTPLSWLLSESSLYDQHRRQIEFTLDELAKLQLSDGPTFVFAHLMSPHPPFVFGPDGEPRTPDYPFTTVDGPPLKNLGLERTEYREQYRDQLRYLNTRLEQSISAVLARPRGRQAVVLVQGDHGPRIDLSAAGPNRGNAREALATLVALRLPGADMGELPESFSTVNIFRLVLNQYFGADYELLPNRSFYSRFSAGFDLQEVARPTRTVRYAEVSGPSAGAVALADPALEVILPAPSRAAYVAGRLSRTTDYTFQLLAGERVLATASFPRRHRSQPWHPVDHEMEVPEAARKEGFDRIRISSSRRGRYYHLWRLHLDDAPGGLESLESR